jgi:hypothetical protein
MAAVFTFFCIFEETEFELESIKKEDEGKTEKMSRFFEVEEMFDFDNLGFTNTRDNFKARHFVFNAVLGIRICMFLGPPDPLVTSTDPIPDPFIIQQNKAEKTLIFTVL